MDQPVRRPTVYQINLNQSLYPQHHEILRRRSLHVRTRMMERFGMIIGIKTYAKMSELCGKELMRWLSENPKHRFKMTEYQFLGSPDNPRYALVFILDGQKFRVIYDAYDRMILTTMHYGTFNPSKRLKLTPIGIEMTKDGEVSYFEDEL